jgi:hypothetical protein
VGSRTGNFAANTSIVSAFITGTNRPVVGFISTGNQMFLFNGTLNPSIAAADNQFHAFQGIFNGASSIIAVDGAQVAGNPGSPGTSTTLGILANADGTSINTGYMGEIGLYATAFSPTQISNTNSNQRAYYGF